MEWGNITVFQEFLERSAKETNQINGMLTLYNNGSCNGTQEQYPKWKITNTAAVLARL